MAKPASQTAARTRVLCCTAGPHPAAMKALAAHAPHAEIIDVGEDPYGYWREIAARWAGHADLIIIEQDIEVGPGTIGSLEACGEPWCVYAYPIFRDKVRLKLGLGCTKISAAAQRLATADLIAQGFWLCAVCKGKGCWWHLDGRVTEVLRGRGYAPHIHGDITHHHDYGSTDPHQRGVWEIPFLAEAAAGAAPAVAIVHGVPWAFAETPVQATARANQLADLARIAAQSPPPEPGPAGGFGQLIGPAAVTGPAAPFATDKIAHGYMPAYHRIAAGLGPAARVCEVGVFFGGSLATWQVIFPAGVIAGVDCYDGAQWPDGTIEIRARQDDPALPGMLAAHSDRWDLIIDDASHDGTLTGATLDLLWPLVAPGGFYVIEDWFTGYDDYPGYDDSMLRLAESLLQRLREDTDTASVEYRHGLAIIRKKALAHEFLR